MEDYSAGQRAIQAQLQEEIEALKEENKALNEELRVSQAAKAYLGDTAYNRMMAAFVGEQARVRRNAKRKPSANEGDE